jgi:hypothetical protein
MPRQGRRRSASPSPSRNSKPRQIKRGPVYFYISRWPADGVTNEVSIKMGYPFGAAQRPR